MRLRRAGLYLLLLTGLTGLAGCFGTKTRTVASLGATQSSLGTKTRWSQSGLTSPINLTIAQDFEDEFVPGDEVGGLNLFEQMAKRWDDVLPAITFFQFPFNTVTNKTSTNLRSYQDSQMGIYKSLDWFDEVSSSALAITQFFAFRKNVGTSTEYLELDHADIMVNYKNFTFHYQTGQSGYDLPTVILHELGHFLGLPHQSNFAEDSIMLPFLSPSDTIRTLTPTDRSMLTDNYAEYFTAPLTALLLKSMAVSSGKNILDNTKEGEAVRGIIELRTDGHCYLKLEGQSTATLIH